MATTTNYGWTTPDDTALVKDGAAAIRSLGTAIDSTVFTNAGAAVTKATVDAKGDLIAGTADNTVARLAVGANDTVLTADSSAATGLKWAAASSSFPASDTASITTQETTTSTSYTDLTTSGPAVTLTTGTKALVIVTARMWNQSADYVAMMSFAVSGATTISASDNNAAYARRGTDTVINRFSTATLVTGLTAGSNTFTTKYRADIAGTAAYRERTIFVMNLA
jgi:hypothetical protein